jgi:hypothetical protein
MRLDARVVSWFVIALVAIGLPLVLLNSNVWPLSSVVAGDTGGDYGMFTWNSWQMTEAVLGGRDPFSAPAIYYPVGGHLARHTYAFGFFPIGVLTKALMLGSPLYPISAYRASIWVAFALGIALGWAALRDLGASRSAALWAAVAYTFSAFFLAHIPHTNLIAGAFVLPAITLAASRAWRSPTLGSWIVLGTAVGLSVYFSELSVFAVLALAITSAVGLLTPGLRREFLARFPLGRGVGGVAIVALCAVVIAAPFLASWAGDEAKAPKAEASFRSSADLLGFVVPDGAQQPLYAQWASRPRRGGTGIGGRETFIGFPLLILAVIGLLQRGSSWPRVALAVGALFLLLSLGPELHVGGGRVGVPLPYEWLMRVPPFNMARTPVRLIAVCLWCLACVGGQALTGLQGRLRSAGRRYLAGGLTLALLGWSIAEGYRAGPAVAALELPPALSNLSPGPVINVPISFMDGHAMFLQVFHGRPIVTGYLARRTPAQVELVRSWDALLERGVGTFIDELARQGIRTVIVGPGTNREWLGALRGAGLTVVDARGLE